MWIAIVCGFSVDLIVYDLVWMVVDFSVWLSDVVWSQLEILEVQWPFSSVIVQYNTEMAKGTTLDFVWSVVWAKDTVMWDGKFGQGGKK